MVAWGWARGSKDEKNLPTEFRTGEQPPKTDSWGGIEGQASAFRNNLFRNLYRKSRLAKQKNWVKGGGNKKT